MKRAEEEGVSPVIGVLLLVAITVVLAAIIAVFVFGMAGSIAKTYTVAATAEMVGPQRVDVMIHGGQDLPKVKWLAVSAEGTGTITYSPDTDGNVSFPQVGTIIHVDGPGITHVYATAHFIDNTEQVILDRYF